MPTFPPPGPDDGDDYAAAVLEALMGAADTGDHRFTIAAVIHGTPIGYPLTVEITDGAVRAHEDAVSGVLNLLAAVIKGGHRGGITLRTRTGPDAERLCGWAIRGLVTWPLNRAQLFAACCTDPATGAPVGPEPGVEYADAPPLMEGQETPPAPGD